VITCNGYHIHLQLSNTPVVTCGQAPQPWRPC